MYTLHLHTCLITLSATIILFGSFLRGHAAPPPVSFPPKPSNKPPHCCPVNESLLWQKPLLGLDPLVLTRVTPFFEYKFLLPERQLKASLEYYGTSVRLRNFMTTLMYGLRPLKIGVLGGSWSLGCCSEDRQVDSWFPLVEHWLRSVSTAPITSRNGGKSATAASFMVYCFREHMDVDADLIFIEYAPNDPVPNNLRDNSAVLHMEKLIRRLLALPKQPAIVLVENPRLTPTGFHGYDVTSEFLQGPNARFYDIPIVSPHAALHQLVFHAPNVYLPYGKLFAHKHPGSAGHRCICDTVIHLFQTAVMDLAHRPFGQADLDALAAPLPASIHKGNLPPADVSCTMGAALPSLAPLVSGFTLLDEGWAMEPRVGYIATVPGSVLELTVDTLRPDLAPGVPVSLSIVYPAAKGMGQARLECVQGCSCRGTKMDAYSGWGDSHSMTQFTAASQNATCVVRVTVLNETKSDGYKFKVNGVVVATPPAWD